MPAPKRPSSSATVLVAHQGAELYGSDRVMLESVSGLIDDGWSVVVTVPSDGPLVAELRARGARVALCPTPVLRRNILRPRGLLRFLRDAAAGLRQGSALLRRERPALVYVNTIAIPLWTVLARFRRIPSLTHVHEAESGGPRIVRQAMTWPLLLADALIGNSRFSVGVLASAFRRLGRRAVVVHNAVPGPPASTRRPVRRDLDGVVRLAYVGRLSPRKGVDLAVDALAELRARGLDGTLDLIGAPFEGYEWYERELRERASAHNLDGAVRFHGFQPSVWGMVAECDVMVVPSRMAEPFGNVAVEAILAGRPVVVAAIGGLREAADGYGAASAVTPDDPIALADALESMVGSWDAVVGSIPADERLAEERHGVETYRRRIAGIVRRVARTSSRGGVTPTAE